MRALPLYKEAIKLNTDDAGERSFVTLQSMFALAETYNLLGRQEEARTLHEQVLKLRIEVMGPQHPDTIMSMVNLAKIDQKLERKADALALCEKIVPAVETLRANGDLSPENRQILFAQWVDAYKSYADMLIDAHREAEAFHISELSKARTLLESTAICRANQSDLLSEEEQNRIREFEKHLAWLNNEIVSAISQPERRFSLEANKNELITKYAELRREMGLKYPKYAQMTDVKIINAEQGKVLMPNNAVLISYLMLENKPIVFTLSSDGLTAQVLKEIPNLAQTIEAYRSLIMLPLRSRKNFFKKQKIWKLTDGSFVFSSSSPKQSALLVKAAEDLGQYLSVDASYANCSIFNKREACNNLS